MKFDDTKSCGDNARMWRCTHPRTHSASSQSALVLLTHANYLNKYLLSARYSPPYPVPCVTLFLMIRYSLHSVGQYTPHQASSVSFFLQKCMKARETAIQNKNSSSISFSRACEHCVSLRAGSQRENGTVKRCGIKPKLSRIVL